MPEQNCPRCEGPVIKEPCAEADPPWKYECEACHLSFKFRAGGKRFTAAMPVRDGKEDWLDEPWFAKVCESLGVEYNPGAMEDHLYLAVICKTPGCTTQCLLKYLGLYSGQIGVQELAPEWFDFQCGECRRTHHYRRAEIYPSRTYKAPSREFQNSF